MAPTNVPKYRELNCFDNDLTAPVNENFNNRPVDPVQQLLNEFRFLSLKKSLIKDLLVILKSKAIMNILTSLVYLPIYILVGK